MSQSISEVAGIRRADKGKLCISDLGKQCLKTEFVQEPGTSTCSTCTDSFSHHVYFLTGKGRKNILNLKLEHWFNTYTCFFFFIFFNSKVASQGCVLFEPFFSPLIVAYFPLQSCSLRFSSVDQGTGNRTEYSEVRYSELTFTNLFYPQKSLEHIIQVT